jgi:uncharacterized protein (DUF885 family)
MFEEIKKKLADQPDLLKVLEDAEATIKQNVEKINYLETETKKLVDQRQELKQMVRDTLGISELSKEALERVAKSADEAIIADNKALQEQLRQMENQLSQVEDKYETKISTMILKDTLRGLGVDQQAANSLAFENLTNHLLQQAKRDEDGNFIFVKEDGSTEFNRAGQPMTVKEKVEELKRSDYAFLFKPEAGSGSGQVEKQPEGSTAPTMSEGTQYVLENFA